MTPDDITKALTTRFGEQACQRVSDDAWKVETDGLRLLAIRPGPWIKLMVPLIPIAEAQPYVSQMLTANFDETQEARYAFHQDVVWGIFQYNMVALGLPQFTSAVDQLLALKANGVSDFFSNMVEAQVTQIIVASKRQGQSLEATLQTLDRFYAEGMMGDMGDSSYQNNALASWQRQLERLWPIVEVESDRLEDS
ncbi:MAG: hypothetical protein WBD47_07590 [Phormidesmis sp.]